MEDLVIVTDRRLNRTINGLWAKIKATFPLKNHTHTISQVTGLQAALDKKADANHTQAISTIIGLTGRLNKIEKLAKAGL